MNYGMSFSLDWVEVVSVRASVVVLVGVMLGTVQRSHLHFGSWCVFHTSSNIRVVLVSIWIALLVVANWAVGTFVDISRILTTPRVVRMHLSSHSYWLTRCLSTEKGLLVWTLCYILLVLHLLILTWAKRTVVDWHQHWLPRWPISIRWTTCILHTHNNWIPISHPIIASFWDIL